MSYPAEHSPKEISRRATFEINGEMGTKQTINADQVRVSGSMGLHLRLINPKEVSLRGCTGCKVILDCNYPEGVKITEEGCLGNMFVDRQSRNIETQPPVNEVHQRQSWGSIVQEIRGAGSGGVNFSSISGGEGVSIFSSAAEGQVRLTLSRGRGNDITAENVVISGGSDASARLRGIKNLRIVSGQNLVLTLDTPHPESVSIVVDSGRNIEIIDRSGKVIARYDDEGMQEFRQNIDKPSDDKASWSPLGSQRVGGFAQALTEPVPTTGLPDWLNELRGAPSPSEPEKRLNDLLNLTEPAQVDGSWLEQMEFLPLHGADATDIGLLPDMYFLTEKLYFNGVRFSDGMMFQLVEPTAKKGNKFVYKAVQSQ